MDAEAKAVASELPSPPKQEPATETEHVDKKQKQSDS